MTINISKGKSLIYYNGETSVSLVPYVSCIDQVLEIYEEGRWFKLFNPSIPSICEFETLTPSLSYLFLAYSDFTITV